MRSRTRRGASWPGLAAGAGATILLVWLALNRGGYFPADHVGASVVAFLLLAITLAASWERQVLSPRGVAALLSLLALTVLTGVSAAWSPVPDRAVEALQLDLFYVAVLALGLVAAGSGRHARHLVLFVFAGLVLVAGAGVLQRLFPSVVDLAAAADVAEYRMYWPVGYWNAMGGVGACGLVLAFGLAADARQHPAARAGAAAAGVLCGVAVHLTLSRGSMASAVIGVAVVILVARRRGATLASLAVLGAGVGAAIAVVRGFPELVDDPFAGEGQAAAGRRAAPLLGLVAVATAGAQYAVAVAGHRTAPLQAVVRRRARPVLAAAGVLTVLVLGGASVAGGSVDGAVAEATEASTDFADAQWQDFQRSGSGLGGREGVARLTTARGGRSDLWDVALDGFGDAPLRGLGAGAYEVLWYERRPNPSIVRNAHSFPLETMAELGILGAAALAAFMASVVTAVVRSRRHRLALTSAQTAAVAGAVVVWLTHAAVDWDWQLPGFTGFVLLLLGALFPPGRRRTPREQGPAAHAAARA